jgi:hypothetical protein
MNHAEELDILRRTWAAGEPAAPSHLAGLVRRQRRSQLLYAVSACLGAALFFAATLRAAVLRPTAEFVALAIGVWMMTLTALIWSLRNRAGLWARGACTTREYLEGALAQCRARLRSVRFGLWLVAVQVVLLAGWHGWYWSSRSERPPLALWLVASLVPASFFVVLLLARRTRLRQYTRLEELLRELAS